MQARDRGHRGFILIVALAFLAGIMALIAVGTSRSLTERAAAERYVAKQQAFYLAEGGVDQALAKLATNPDWTCTGCLTFPEVAAATASYDVAGTAPTKTITARGSVGGITRTLGATVTVQPQSLFRWPLFGATQVRFGEGGGGGVIDSYDASQGPYPYSALPFSADRPVLAPIRTNGTTSGVIWQLGEPWYPWDPDPRGPIHFWGDLIVGPGADPTTAIVLGPISVVHGEKRAATETVTLPPVTPPAGSPSGSLLKKCPVNPDIPVSTFPYSSITLPTNCTIRLTGNGTVHLSALTLNAGSTVELAGEITLSMGALTMGSSTRLTVKSGAAQLYLTGAFTDAGVLTYGSLKNETLLPKNLAFYVVGQTNVHLEWPSGESFYGTIYAPSALVALSALEGDFFGSCISKTTSISGTGMSPIKFHYDTSLGTPGTGGAASVDVRYWHEQ